MMATSLDRADTAHLGERLGALVEHELPPAEDARAREHLAACDHCRREHDRLAGTLAAVAGLGRARAPEGFAGRLLRRLRSERRVAGLHSALEQKVPYEGTIVVLLVAAMAVVLLTYLAGAAKDGLFAKAEPGKQAPAAVEVRP